MAGFCEFITSFGGKDAVLVVAWVAAALTSAAAVFVHPAFVLLAAIFAVLAIVVGLGC